MLIRRPAYSPAGKRMELWSDGHSQRQAANNWTLSGRLARRRGPRPGGKGGHRGLSDVPWERRSSAKPPFQETQDGEQRSCANSQFPKAQPEDLRITLGARKKLGGPMGGRRLSFRGRWDSTVFCQTLRLITCRQGRKDHLGQVAINPTLQLTRRARLELETGK